jgi:two-component system NtrC family sensor kinase
LESLHVPYAPTVSVSTRLNSASMVEIYIRDNGTGIPDSLKAKIFQPFFTTKPTGQGTGLGLSLAYDIVVKGHGGTLEVKSTEGDGTEFVIRFPDK